MTQQIFDQWLLCLRLCVVFQVWTFGTMSSYSILLHLPIHLLSHDRFLSNKIKIFLSHFLPSSIDVASKGEILNNFIYIYKKKVYLPEVDFLSQMSKRENRCWSWWVNEKKDDLLMNVKNLSKAIDCVVAGRSCWTRGKGKWKLKFIRNLCFCFE